MKDRCGQFDFVIAAFAVVMVIAGLGVVVGVAWDALRK